VEINWAAISAIVSVITLVGVVGVGGVMWGTLSEKVATAVEGLKTNASDHAHFDTRLTAHEVQLGRLEEWKNGYNAAVRTGSNVGTRKIDEQVTV
jgi:hypothetical protein